MKVSVIGGGAWGTWRGTSARRRLAAGALRRGFWRVAKGTGLAGAFLRRS